MLDAEACSHGSMMKVAIFSARQTLESPEFRVHGGVEPEARPVDGFSFRRVALCPPHYRGALLGDLDPSRPQIHA